MSNRRKHEEIHDQQELCECCASWVFDTCHYKEAKSAEAFSHTQAFTKDMLTGRRLEVCEPCIESAAQDLDMEFCDDVLAPDAFQKLWDWVRLEAVLNFIGYEDEPKDIGDVQEFFDALCGLMLWHPDDGFDQYVYGGTGERIFTDEQAVALDKIMQNCFAICDMEPKDIYELGLEAMQRAGQAPTPGTAQEEMRGQVAETPTCVEPGAKTPLEIAISALALIKHYQVQVDQTNALLVVQAMASEALTKIVGEQMGNLSE